MDIKRCTGKYNSNLRNAISKMQFILFFYCGLLSKEVNAMFLPMSLEAYSVSSDTEIKTGYCRPVYGPQHCTNSDPESEIGWNVLDGASEGKIILENPRTR